MEPEMGVRWPQAEKRRQLPTVVLQETLESPLDSKEIKLVNPKGNQPWIFIGRTDAEDEAPILWPPNMKSWLIRKDSDAGKDWRQGEKAVTGDEMIGWHHQFNGHEFEQIPGDGEGQGSLACCNPWVTKCQTQLSDWTTTLYRPKTKSIIKYFNISFSLSSPCPMSQTLPPSLWDYR